MTPHEEEISAEQAADVLSVSQPYLDGLLDGGEIPSNKVGGRRLLQRSDVVRFRGLEQARRLDAVNALAAEAQELGIY